MDDSDRWVCTNIWHELARSMNEMSERAYWLRHVIDHAEISSEQKEVFLEQLSLLEKNISETQQRITAYKEKAGAND